MWIKTYSKPDKISPSPPETMRVEEVTAMVKQLKKKFNRIVNDLNKRLKTKDKMIYDMRKDLTSMKAERERLISSYETKIKEHVHTMEKYHADIQLVRKQQEKEGENMKGETALLRDTINATEKTHSQLMEDVTKLQGKLKDARLENDALKEQQAKAQALQKDLRHEKDSAVQDLKHELQASMSEKNALLAELEKQKSFLLDEIETLRENNSDIKGRNSTLREEIESFKARVETMVHGHHQEITRIKMQHEQEIQKQNYAWLKEREDRKQKDLVFKNDYQRLETSIENLKQDHASQLEQLRKKHAEQTELSKSHQTLTMMEMKNKHETMMADQEENRNNIIRYHKDKMTELISLHEKRKQFESRLESELEDKHRFAEAIAE